MWPYPVTIGTEMSGLRVDAMDTTVSVPAGTFRSIHYSTLPTGAGFTYFVAPRVGLVKRISEPFVIKDIFSTDENESVVRFVYSLKGYSVR
jgi:hypothetical protein